MDSITRARKHALEAALREINRNEAEDKAAAPKVKASAEEPTERHFTQRQKLDAFVAQQGRCAICGGKFMLSEMEMDHRVSLGLSGPEEPSNHEMLCKPCHAEKTVRDAGQRAKAKRQSRLLKPREPSRHRLQSRGFR